ncbi:OmpA family protein [candidate division KSB1 bacterium]|nr:OmpA family protein [candidate division KSB1 bacterium]
MRIRLIYAIVIISSVLSILSAQTWDQRFAAGAHLGAFKLWGGEYNRSTISGMIGLNAYYGILPTLQLGLDAGYGSFRPSALGGIRIIPEDDAEPFRTTVIPVSLTLRATLPSMRNEERKWYGLLGVGALMWDLKNIDENSPENGQSVHGQQTNMTILIGAGLEWLLAKSWGLDFRVQNTFLLDQKLDNTGYGDDANSMMLQGRIGLSYYFGGFIDTDGDGIPDKSDGAPLLAEDFDGFQDRDGIPDLDNDNDGIPDERDGEPNLPEDKDGFQDEDGIPDLDNDGDGIPDTQDGAPLEPEDKDGYEDEDGVPDPDNDGDGINDVDDECPNEPETFNDYMDNDGCPDQKPVAAVDSLVEMKTAEQIVLRGVNFEHNSADLTREARDILRSAANILLAHQEIRLKITGHTDNTGTAEYNQRLSNQRAEAVKTFLINNGIAADRLTTEGRGDTEPLADNSTEEGMAKNRRIEFERID